MRWVLISFAVLLLAGALGLGGQLYLRWNEARTYDDAPICSAAETARGASGTCKVVTEATVAKVTCDPKRWYGGCEFAFTVPVDGASATRTVLDDPRKVGDLHSGDRVRLELFQGHITRLAVKDEMTTVIGTPKFAVNAMAIMVPLAFICGLLLLRLSLRLR